MGATAAAIITTRPGRVRYSLFATVSGAACTCPMCGAPIEAHTPHACAKPDLDQPPHAVPPRCAPFESATFPFLIHRGIAWRFEGRTFYCTNEVNFIQSRAQFYELVSAGILEEVPYDEE